MKKIIFIILCCLCIFFTSAASAATIEISDDISLARSGFNIDFLFYDVLSATTVNDEAAPAGEFNILLDGFSNAAFCVELGIPYGSGEADLTIPSVGSAYYQAAWLMDSFSTGLGFDTNQLITDFTFPGDYTGTVYQGYDEENKTFLNGVNETIPLAKINEFDNVALKNIADVAVQIAIWEALYQDDFSNGLYSYNNKDGEQVTSMDFADDGKRLMAWSLADIYKTKIPTDLSDDDFSGKYKFYVAEFEENQNLLVAKPIPEPATIMLFGLGLLGISAVGRKRS